MHEILEQILAYLRGIWRYRWFAIALAWTVSLAGWTVVWQMPDRYTASARVQVDTESMLRPLLSGLAIQTDVRHRLQMMTRTILSRPNLEKIARMTDLDLKAKTAEETEALLNRLGKDIHIGSGRQQDLYTITYEHNSPEVAKRVVQALLTIFVEHTLGEKRVDSDTAQKFLQTQIQEYEAKLVAAEQRLQEFKKENADLMSAMGRGYFQQLEAAQSELQQARLLLNEETRRRDELRRQLKGEVPVFGLMGPSGSQGAMQHPLDARIAELQTHLDDLLLRFTEQHPEVISVRNMIASLEQRKRQDAGVVQESAPPPPGLEENPVYQQMRIALAQAEANVASLQVRVDEYAARVQRLKEKVDTIPEVEAQLTRLNRDYDIHKKNYDTLVARLETAKISEDAEQTGEGVKFKVIDPPRVPLSPTGPNRPLFSSAVFVLSLVMGTALAFLLAQIRPTFYDRRVLQQITGLPVFGSISKVHTNAQMLRRRMEMAMFFSVLLTLGALFGGVVLLQTGGQEWMAPVLRMFEGAAV